MRAIKRLPNRAQLPLLEFADRDAALAVDRPDHRRVHQLQDRALPERMRDDLRASALLRDLSSGISASSRRRHVAAGGRYARVEATILELSKLTLKRACATLRPTRISATFSRVAPQSPMASSRKTPMQVTAVKTRWVPAWRWRFVNDTGAMVEESRETFPTIAAAVASGAARLQAMAGAPRADARTSRRATSHVRSL